MNKFKIFFTNKKCHVGKLACQIVASHVSNSHLTFRHKKKTINYPSIFFPKKQQLLFFLLLRKILLFLCNYYFRDMYTTSFSERDRDQPRQYFRDLFLNRFILRLQSLLHSMTTVFLSKIKPSLTLAEDLRDFPRSTSSSTK